MTKRRNVKSHNFRSNSDVIKLKNILNEVQHKQSIQLSSILSGVKRSGVLSLDESTIKSILKSDMFTSNEVIALENLFNTSKVNSLNESTVRTLDKNVKTITSLYESGRILDEGFFSNLKDNLKKLGSKAKEAIAGGWSKLKTVWSAFKDLVQQVINMARNGIEKLTTMSKEQAKKEGIEIANKVIKTGFKAAVTATNASAVADARLDPDFVKEIKELWESGNWWRSTFYKKWFNPPFWAKDVLAGKGNADPISISVDTTEAGEDIEQLDKMESLINKRNNILSDSKIQIELVKHHSRLMRLKEGGHAVEHLDDVLKSKNESLYIVVNFAIELIQWAFIPLAKLGQKIGKWAGPKILNKFSVATNTMGGPGIYLFELLGLLVGEILEIVIKKLALKFASDTIKDIIFPGWGIAANIVEGIHTALLLWTIANIFINMVDVVQKDAQKQTGTEPEEEAGTEPEVQTAGYKPKGSFKLKEGNLVFIK
jgi:hypothetical protein